MVVAVVGGGGCRCRCCCCNRHCSCNNLPFGVQNLPSLYLFYVKHITQSTRKGMLGFWKKLLTSLRKHATHAEIEIYVVSVKRQLVELVVFSHVFA